MTAAYNENGLSAEIIDGEAVVIRLADCGTRIELTLQEFTDMAYAVLAGGDDA